MDDILVFILSWSSYTHFCMAFLPEASKAKVALVRSRLRIAAAAAAAAAGLR